VEKVIEIQQPTLHKQIDVTQCLGLIKSLRTIENANFIYALNFFLGVVMEALAQREHRLDAVIKP
jgi:hypothetical protein